ncbi:MAG: hypothetical protein K8E66_08345, partial [Phycisphaerales bacterium]|nr:hypothetical protein [Phycisphaerales bacterium]
MERKHSVLALCAGVSAACFLNVMSRADVIPISCERNLDVVTYVLDTDTFDWDTIGFRKSTVSMGSWNVEEHTYLASGWNRSNTDLGIGPYADLYVANSYDFTDFAE